MPDGGVDAFVPVDAAVVGDAACVPAVTVDEGFTTSLGGWTKHSYSTSNPAFDYPKLEVYDGAPSTVILPIRREGNELYDVRSGLWFPSVVPLVALDVSADVDVRCTSPSSCADGFLVTWLDTKDHGALDTTTVGGNPLPPGIAGAAVLFDTYRSPEINDPVAPSLQIVTPGRTTPSDGWRVGSVSSAFLGGPHRLTLSLRGETLRVSLDGSVRISDKVPVFASGLFGFVASTGGQTDAVAIRNVSASFYPCTPP